MSRSKQTFRIRGAGWWLLILSTVSNLTVSAHQDHPLGVVELDWRPDPAIARTVSINYDAHAGQFLISRRPPGRIESIEGRTCLAGSLFAFDVNDDRIFNDDARVTLELLFDRSRGDGFILSYDHAVSPVSRRIDFGAAANGRWHRETVSLERARFANRRYAGTDFAVAATGTAYPAGPDDSASLMLCDLRVHIESRTPPRATGELNLRVLDDSGNPAAVRAGLYDGEGVAPLPGTAAVPVQRYSESVRQLSLLPSNAFWPGAGPYVFYIDGDYQADLPEGEYTLILSRGPEFRTRTRTLTIEAGVRTDLTVRLQRWRDLPASGWYSGDVHIHMARPDANANPGVLAFTRAEDIHLGNLLMMDNLGDVYYHQYAFGEEGEYLYRDYALASGQEAPRTPHLGHTIGLNGREFHRDPEHYYLYDRIARHIHDDGGLFGFAHIALAEVFDLDRGLLLGVPLGYVDFLEVLQMGVLNTDHLYNFLNLGYRLLPAAGSDFPYVHMAGAERTYVKVSGEFSPQKWFDAWQNGRSFVSNAPVLEFSVNGNDRDSVIRVAAGKALTITGRAGVNPDFDRLQRVDLVVQGEVISTMQPAEPAEDIEFEYTFQPQHALWFALRAHGERGSVAHSAPVYVQLDNDARFWKREAVRDIAEHYLARLEQLRDSEPDPGADFEIFDTRELLVSQWLRDRPELLRQIENARKEYRRLIKEAGQ